MIKRRDAGIKKRYTYFERAEQKYKCAQAALHTHPCTYTNTGQRLSDKQELWVGRLVGLRGNMR